MFYLSGSTEPTNHDEFIRALDGGLRQAFVFPSNAVIVTTEGNYPAYELFKIDFTGGRIDPSRMPPKPAGIGPAHPAATAKVLRIIAAPAFFGAARVTAEMSVTDAALDYGRDAAGRLLLMPNAWRNGRVSAEVPRADLEPAVLAEAAAP